MWTNVYEDVRSYNRTGHTIKAGNSMDAVKPNVIQAIAVELQQGHVGDARAAELAVEVGRLNAAVLREVNTLKFEDEPGHFVRALADAAR
jgi:hypothetical protein